MKVRYVTNIIMLVIGMVFLFGCSDGGEEGTKKIGVISPFTGDLSEYGGNEKRGIELARAIADTAYPNTEVEVLYEDNQGEATQAVSAMRRLKSEGVKYYIDDAVSTITLSLVQYLGEDAIMISTGATSPKLTDSSPYFFRVWNSDLEEGAYAARATDRILSFNKPKSSEVAVVYVNNDYGSGLKKVYSDSLKKIRQSVSIEEFSYARNKSDFKNISSKLKEYDPSLIYIVGYGPTLGILVRDIRSIGLNTQILGGVTVEDPKFLEQAGDTANGVRYVYKETPTGSTYKMFKKKFKMMHGKEPGILADVAFDATMLYIKAFSKGHSTPSQLKEYFINMSSYNGASGLIKFDEKGNVHKPYDIKMVKDGKFELHKD